MGQRRLAKPQADDANKRPAAKKQTNNTVLNHTNTRKDMKCFVHSVAPLRMSICAPHSTSSTFR